MFGFGKSKRIATMVKDIQMAVVSQSYIFAASIAKGVDAPLSDASDPMNKNFGMIPMYEKVIMRDDDSNRFSYVDQISFSNEAMAFYLNVLARACYSAPKPELAGTVILTPSVLELLELFAKAAHSVLGGGEYF